MAALPTGRVTYLFTDVVGSTSLWEESTDAMALAMARHDTLVERAVTECRGHLVRPRGEGDSRFAVFPAAANALTAAARVVADLCAEPWPTPRPIAVRVAVHTGEAEVRAGDYYGPAVNRTARLRAIGHPNQVLISAATVSDAADQLGTGLALRDLGTYRLRDLTEPEHVYQLLAPGAPEDFPPLAPLERPGQLSELRPAGPALVGRAAELNALKQAVSDVVGGSGQLVLLTGEPGIGKTRMAEEVEAMAVGRHANVVWARCQADSAQPAFWPWIQSIRGLLAIGDREVAAAAVGSTTPELANLVPELADIAPVLDAPPVDSEGARFRLYDSVMRFLSQLAAHRPLVLIIDDLHWADLPSLRLIAFVAGQLRTTPLLLVGTFRNDEVPLGSPHEELLGVLITLGRTLRLRPLSEADVAALVAASGARPDPALASSVHGRSGGNPLFVLELCGALSDDEGGGRDVSALSLPGGALAVLDRRFARLAAPVLDLLLVASAAGDEFSADLLAEVMDTEVDAVVEPLDEAIAAKVIVVRDDVSGTYAYAHPLVRQALYERLSHARRKAVHRRFGEVLERADSDGQISQLAYHFLRAGGIAASKGVDYSERAGREALDVLAFEEAAAHFSRALSVLTDRGKDPERRAEILLALADSERRAGNVGPAKDAFEQVAEWARRHRRPNYLARAALGYAADLGGFEVTLFDQRQLDLLEEALLALGAEDSTVRALTLGRLSVALSLVDSPERRRALSEEAVDVSRRIGDDAALAYALATHCDVIAGPADTRQRLSEATEVVDLATRVRDRSLELLGRRLRLVALLELGDFSSADVEIEAFGRVADASRDPLYSWYLPMWRGMRAHMDGRFAEHDSLIEEAEALGRRAGSENATMLLHTVRIVRALDAGDGDAAEACVADFTGEVAYLPVSNQIALATIWSGTDRTARSHAVLDRLAATGLGGVPRDSEWLPSICQLAETCNALLRPDVAEMAYAELEPFGDLFAIEGIGAATRGSAFRHLGLLCDVLGRTEEATQRFEDALAANRRAGSPLFVAHTLRDYGACLQRAPGGSPETGDELLREAALIYGELGLPRQVESVRRRRDAHVLRSGPGTRRR